MRAFSQYVLEVTRKRLVQAAGVTFLLGMMVVPALAQDASPDRLVAEWMLRMGGSVVLEGQHTSISDVANLPSSDFYVQTLNFTGITQWASALEDELRRLPQGGVREGLWQLFFDDHRRIRDQQSIHSIRE